MLMQEAIPEMIKNWKAISEEYKAKLRPNRKPASAIIEYLEQKYQLEELSDEEWNEVIIGNVMLNDINKCKLPVGKVPTARVFHLENVKNGKLFYEKQDNIFKGQDIFVGIEMETGFIHVEGSSLLWDELFAFRGLDTDDLKNFYLVAEYITCLKKFDMLDSVLTPTK